MTGPSIDVVVDVGQPREHRIALVVLHSGLFVMLRFVLVNQRLEASLGGGKRV